MTEKRRCHRLKMELPAHFISPTSPGHVSVATVLDLSAIGICFTTREKLETDQELLMQVTLSSGERVNINVKVIWARETDAVLATEYRVGVKLMEPMKADEAKFVKFYARHLLATSPR